MNEEPLAIFPEHRGDRSGDLLPDLAARDESRRPRIEELVAFGRPLAVVSCASAIGSP